VLCAGLVASVVLAALVIALIWLARH